jgi:hypothetical protein
MSTTEIGNKKYTTELGATDVLLGRGSGPNDHVGNVHFRELVSERKAEYMATNHRMTKTKIAREIVDQIINAKGRFLKKCEQKEVEGLGVEPTGVDVYEIVDDDTMMEKAKQALRQNASKTRSEIEAKNFSPVTKQVQKTQTTPDFEPLPLSADPTSFSAASSQRAEVPHSMGPPMQPGTWYEQQDRQQQVSIQNSIPVNSQMPFMGGFPANSGFTMQSGLSVPSVSSSQRTVETTNKRNSLRSSYLGHDMSLAEIPDIDVIFENRRGSMTVGEVFKNDPRFKRVDPTMSMDELMDSFQQMNTASDDSALRKMMMSAETMGTIEPMGSMADMSMGTVGSTFSLFGASKGNESKDLLGVQHSGMNSSESTDESGKKQSTERDPRIDFQQRGRESLQSDASISISEVWGGRRKSSSLSGASTSINGAIDAIRKEVDSEHGLPRTLKESTAEGLEAIQSMEGIGMESSDLSILKATFPDAAATYEEAGTVPAPPDACDQDKKRCEI